MAAGPGRPDHELLRKRNRAGRLAGPRLEPEFSPTASVGASAFIVLGAASLVGAAAVAAWLPRGRRRASLQDAKEAEARFSRRCKGSFATAALSPPLPSDSTCLFSLVGVFTWITFHLSAAPYLLSTTALSSLFFVYLIGLVVTPAAGYLITRVGLRAGIAGAIMCAMAGVLLTLVSSLTVVIAGLALLCTGVFIAQTASSTHLRVAAPAGTRVTAAGLYITCYYLGGAAGGVVPGAFWAFGEWPACVGFIVVMQALGLVIALVGWSNPSADSERIREPQGQGNESTLM